MDDFLKQVLSGNGIEPPEDCLQLFNEKFSGAINVEWYKLGDIYEAVFYKDNIEYIAVFDSNSVLIEYKMHLPLEYLPEALKVSAENKGEIMNLVKINKGNRIDYEIIMRDKDLKRFIVHYSDLGKELSSKKL